MDEFKYFTFILLISAAYPVDSRKVPITPKDFRGIPPNDFDGPVSPVVLQKWEEFRNNITSKDRSLLSCLEDQTYSAINDFVNCHMFCPLCSQGYGRCETSGEMRLCICDCDFPSLDVILPLSFECPLYDKWCSRYAESPEQAEKLKNCVEACDAFGFSDAALCGADMEDPPLVRSTCTCLCP